MMSHGWWCHQTMPPLSLRALSFVVFYIPFNYCRWNDSIIMYICNSINYRQYINVIWIYPLELWKKQSLYDYMPKTKWFPTSISWSQLLREIISCCCSYVFDMWKIICQYALWCVYVYVAYNCYNVFAYITISVTIQPNNETCYEKKKNFSPKVVVARESIVNITTQVMNSKNTEIKKFLIMFKYFVKLSLNFDLLTFVKYRLVVIN